MRGERGTGVVSFSPKVVRFGYYDLGDDDGHALWPPATWWQLNYSRRDGAKNGWVLLTKFETLQLVWPMEGERF